MDERINVAGLYIDPLTKTQGLAVIEKRIATGEKLFVTTVYSEFLYFSLLNSGIQKTLNSATLALADGIGVLWAATFLAFPLTAKTYLGKILQSAWQVLVTGSSILLRPRLVRHIIPETIVGADLFWDLAKLAQKNNYSIFLLGGFDDTPKRVARILESHFPGLRIVGASNKEEGDESVVKEITESKADFLFVALGPIKQEQWIQTHIPNLPIKLAIGLGGTFDYVTGKKRNPPRIIRASGLEWLFRLVTQPERYKRIWHGTVSLITFLIRYKVFNSYGFRSNAVTVVFNQRHEVFVARRNPEDFVIDIADESKKGKLYDYWQFPQGGLDPNENVESGAVRELREETGITSVIVLGVSDHTHSYGWNNSQRTLLRNIWYRYHGQKQNIVYFKFTGPESEIQLDQKELVDYAWVHIDKLLKQVHPERHPVVQIVLNDFPQIQNKL